MRRCWLKGRTGDALHAVLCAVGFNLRWLLRAIVRLGLRAVLFMLAHLLALAGTVGKPINTPPERSGRRRFSCRSFDSYPSTLNKTNSAGLIM
ncbi:hypothetical protein R8510_05281 [Ralstonia chuxiongensis]|nr:hypothetical protein R8510_05281 [Ralstonia chuxiongensis]